MSQLCELDLVTYVISKVNSPTSEEETHTKFISFCPLSYEIEAIILSKMVFI